MRRNALALCTLLLSSACYHATVVTGATPSAVVYENQWAHSFIAGLIPPSEVETASKCPSGVAKVETQHSFLNLVAQALTASLYSPMTITVTCAAGRMGSLPLVHGTQDVGASLKQAADVAQQTGGPVLLELPR